MNLKNRQVNPRVKLVNTLFVRLCSWEGGLFSRGFVFLLGFMFGFMFGFYVFG